MLLPKHVATNRLCVATNLNVATNRLCVATNLNVATNGVRKNNSLRRLILRFAKWNADQIRGR